MLRLWLVLVAGLGLAVAGYSAYWAYGKTLMLDGIERWRMDRQQAGWAIEAGEVRLGGYPWRFAASTGPFKVRRPDGVVWDARGLAVHAPAWDWHDLEYRLTGEQRLIVPGRLPVEVTVAAATGHLRLDGRGALEAGRADLATVTARPAGATAAITAAEISVNVVPVPAGTHPLAVGADARARDIVIPVAVLPGLGRRIALAHARLAVAEPLPRRARRAELHAWREAGGELDIERLAMTWGPLEVESRGAVRLDSDLQPEGDLIATVRGYTEMVDALVGAGHLPAGRAPLAKAALSLLATRSGDDGSLQAPLRLGDGELRLGPLKVAEFGRIDWPM